MNSKGVQKVLPSYNSKSAKLVLEITLTYAWTQISHINTRHCVKQSVIVRQNKHLSQLCAKKFNTIMKPQLSFKQLHKAKVIPTTKHKSINPRLRNSKEKFHFFA